jgi:hypothetical protein
MHKQSKPLQNVWIKKTHLVSYGGPDICHFWILMPPFLGCSHRIYLKSSQIMIYSISRPYLQKGFNLCNIPHTCSHLESELQKFPNSRYKLGQASEMMEVYFSETAHINAEKICPTFSYLITAGF